MGWDSCHRPKGYTTKDWLQKEICGENGQYGELLATAGGGGGTVYCAWRLGPAHSDREGTVVGLVVLTRWSSDYFNFSKKVMDEDMGPFYFDCPARILNLLSPTTNENALEWRQKCRDNLAQKAAKPKVRAGDMVRFAAPLSFTNGDELDTFVFLERTTFRSASNGGRYRITRWKEREFEVVGRAA